MKIMNLLDCVIYYTGQGGFIVVVHKWDYVVLVVSTKFEMVRGNSVTFMIK